MSCALPKGETEEIDAASPATPALYAELANGLHAMAQPLTVLRGAMGALILAKGVAPGFERYLEMSSTQVERLCDILGSLRGLLDAAQFDAQSTEFDLAAVVVLVLDELEPVLQGSGARMPARRPDRPIAVIGDAGRAETALRVCLQIAASISAPGDAVEVKWHCDKAFAGVVVEHQRKRGARLSSNDRLSLALAEAAVRSQRGLFACIQDPFQVTLRIPLQRPGESDAFAVCPGSSERMLH
jgi:hypothetical protein